MNFLLYCKILYSVYSASHKILYEYLHISYVHCILYFDVLTEVGGGFF